MLPRLGWVPSLVATALVSLTQATPLNSGVAPFPYGNETFETYYEVFGLQGSQNTPLIVLHGGPGLSHDYLEVFCDLSSSRPIILYDQIGNARSTHLDAKPSSFWTIDLFVKQLESLVSHFGLDDYGVLGHSWGGMLAAEFAVTQPNGLKTLVLSNSPPSAQLWAQSQTQLISTFPPEVQQAIANGYSDPNYKEALLGYFHVHGCTLNPWPRGLDVSFGFTFSDPTVDVQMWTTTLPKWTIVDRLPQINVPTLVINGGDGDITKDWVIQPLLDHIPNAQHHKFEYSTHTPFLEERPAYMEVVGDFLKS